MRKKFVVIENGALCLVTPDRPSVGQILARSVRRIEEFRGVYEVELTHRKDTRPATRQDFQDFRLSSETYLERPDEYDFPGE